MRQKLSGAAPRVLDRCGQWAPVSLSSSAETVDGLFVRRSSKSAAAAARSSALTPSHRKGSISQRGEA